MITLETTDLKKAIPLASWLEKRYKASMVRRAFKKKAVRINGRHAGDTGLVAPGDIVTLHISMEETPWVPEILLDCGNFFIINKPAGAVVQQNEKLSFEESLEGLVFQHFKTLGREAFLVHRLDRDTSGCLLFACDPATLKELKALSGTEGEEKTYLALIKGLPEKDSGSITNKLPGRDGKPVPSLTEFTVLERFTEQGVSLISAIIRTGRLHQIRLHFAGLGFPVAGDEEHGDFRFNRDFKKGFGLKRQFLHARNLSFVMGGKRVSAEAPLPAALEKVLSRLKNPKQQPE
jgi:23S rRNA pseudouridine955/2504/2580 synthase